MESVWRGLETTLIISVLAASLGLLLGTLVAFVTIAKPSRWMAVPKALCKLYITIIRGTPMALQLFIMFYVIFTFRGFPPRGPVSLRNWFAEDRDRPHTLICYESPFRVAATLEAALDALGDREAAVCIELTKLHERVSRGYLSDLVREFRGAVVKGEVTIVIAGDNPKFKRQDARDDS